MRSDIVPGAAFPDYELSDHTAKRRRLSELQGQHPLVLVLSRGGIARRIDDAWNEGRKELFYPYGRTYAQTLGEQD